MSRAIPIILALFFMSSGERPVGAKPISEEELRVAENSEGQPINEEPRGEVIDAFAGLSKRISLDLRAMDIIDTIKFLAKQGDLNLVATRDVSGRVTLFLRDVTIADVLEIVLLTNNLAYEKKEDIIMIMTEREYEALHGEKFTSKKQSRTITLRYADAKRVGTILGALKSAIGKVIIDEITGTIILIDTPQKIKEMEEAARRVDLSTVNRIIPTITETFELEYAKVGEIKGEVSKALTKDIGRVKVDERTNRFVVTDLVHNMEKIRDLIAAFDAKTKQVFIEAKIVEITLSDDYAMGVDWTRLFTAADNLTFTGTFPFIKPDTPSSLAVTMGTLAADDYEFVLELIKAYGKVKTLSSPHIAVLNNEEAKFMVGSREAYVTTTITTGEVTTTTSESVEFIDVGVTLYVTPTINKGGFVRMHIKPEISTVAEWLITTEGNRIPIVATSNVETDVLIKDGRTIIIAGLIKEVEDKSLSKTPFLGDLPLVGNLFRSVSDLYEKKELAIFLTPHIICGEEDLTYLKEGEKARKPAK